MNVYDDPFFVSLMFISIFGVISGMCILPCLVCERCFATYFVSNYEVNQKKYVSLFLVFVLFSIGFSSCYFVQRTSNTVYIVIILLFCNVFALIVNGHLRLYNTTQYTKSHSTGKSSPRTIEYSLTERYQITENIQTLRVMLNYILFYMGLMNILLVLSVMMSGFEEITPERQAICSIVLDSCIFIYSNSLSHIITYCCEKWRRHLSTIWKKIGCGSRSAKTAPLCDTFGSEMNVNITVETYFDTLRNTWNSSAPEVPN
uniref:G_PROTEIN_RECEP_F1_2 domain-containing protein n=1 Tax=Caenorhabditis tropicalis TaxID=1561998 RepID=A0A1I7T9K7_9PELO